VKPKLDNPVFDALISGDRQFANGTENVNYFDTEISPFVGIKTGYEKGFDHLFALLPEGRFVLHATPENIDTPQGWKLVQKVPGIQMILTDSAVFPSLVSKPVSLGEQHVAEMVELTTLTRPGPFGLKTILFGNYHGIFQNGKLAAMAGQRLHPYNFTEISAVCTHPDFLGKGFAAALVQHQAECILAAGRKAFLHVRKDNERAITLYQRLGFVYSGDMNFYFMKRLA
jgi:ribosomal protein S18 acetylase RimI-like enzyme